MKSLKSMLVPLVLAAAPFAAHAQQYPSKPITVINAFAPGGTSDFLARILAQKLSEGPGWRLVIESKPGASGHIGTEYAAKAAPDGYTLCLGPSSTHAINPSVFKDMKYDVQRDFVGITLLAKVANVMAVNPAVPATNVRELIAYAKANPGKLAYASAGTGTSIHISGEMFKDAAGVDILHVPYKGSGPATAAAIGGEVQILFENISTAVPQIKGGRLRALAVTSPGRQAVLPDVPSLAESGLPGFDVQAWFGMFAPSATPREIVQRLNTEFVKVLNMPDVREQLISRGMEPAPLSLEQFAALWKADVEKYAAIVKKAKISVD